MRYVSFSLFGDKPKYLRGAVANARSVNLYYPGWKCVFFADSRHPEVLADLWDAGALVHEPPPGDIGGIYWRHCLPDLIEDVELYVVRDADSRFSRREVDAVNAWLASGKTFHLMRDHPGHSPPIMQGMYGVRGLALKGVSSGFVGVFNGPNAADYYFQQIYDEKMKGDTLEHGEFYMRSHSEQVPFPTPRESLRFVGEIFDEHDQPNDDWKFLLHSKVVAECYYK